MLRSPTQSDSPNQFANDDVREQLNRVLRSEGFRNSPRMQRFLRHVVSATLDGAFGDLKETSIGVLVYEREPGYDPKIDPVVRNEARRLRQKLYFYYENEATPDELVFQLPRGGYVATFAEPSTVKEGSLARQREVSSKEIENSKSSIDTQAEQSGLTSTKALCFPRARGRIYGYAAISLALILGVSWGAWKWRHRRLPVASGRISFTPITNSYDHAIDPTISPDGSTIGFAWNRDSNHYQIYVTRVDGTPLRLTNEDADDFRPSWSPDGHSLAFLRSQSGTTDVVSIEVPGGEEHHLFRLESQLYSGFAGEPTEAGGNPGPRWAPDGRSLLVSEELSDHHSRSIFRHYLTDGQRQQISIPPNGVQDYSSSISPNGEMLSFSRRFTNSISELFVAKSDGRDSRQLTHDHADILGSVWLDDHRILFCSNRSGSYTLSVYDTSREQIDDVPVTGSHPADPSASRDGSVIVYADRNSQSNLQEISIKSSNTHRLFPALYHNHSAQYSPDGKNIAFVSDRSGSWEIWLAHLGSNDPMRLTHFGGPLVGSPRWSPDGKMLAFDARPSGHSAIYIVSTDGKQIKRLFVNEFEERQPSWSLDGKNLYFYSNQSGQGALWKSSVDGTKRTKLCDEPATDPQEANDHFVYFATSGGMKRVSPESGKATTVSVFAGSNLHRLWQVLHWNIFFMEDNGAAFRLKRLDLRTSRIVSFTSITSTPLQNTPSLSLAPDEQNLLISSKEESTSNLIVLRKPGGLL